MPRMGENQESEGEREEWSSWGQGGGGGGRGMDVSVPPAFRGAEKGFKAPVT